MHSTLSRLAGSSALAFALALPLAAQSPLCTPTAPPWSSNNGGSAGWVAMFDLQVNTGVIINQIDCNISGTAGVTPANLEVYMTPTTYVGNELNAAAWSLVATDAGGVLSAGRDNPTSFPLAGNLVLQPGSYGIGIRTLGGGPEYTGTGTGAQVMTSTTEMTLTSGASVAGFFTGSLFSYRNWNGCLHYTPATGLYPAFSATPTTGASPLMVSFTDQTYTSDPGGLQALAWDFDNDGTIDSTVANPTHTYTAPGTYSVSLTAFDMQHGMQTLTKTDLIVVDPVTADFTASTQIGGLPLMVNFTDTSTGLVTNWAWDFDGDGMVDSNLQNPSHTYTAGGSYTVSLTASNSGNIDTVTKTDFIVVVDPAFAPGTADIAEFQFNEPRGSAVANSATMAPAPFGTVTSNAGPANPNWQADPNRNAFGPNEPGFGCLGSDSTSP